MKRFLLFAVLTVMLGGLSGCRLGECWRYAWNSRFHPERNVVMTEPCVVVDSCDPCCDPCGSPCGPIGCATGCGVPATMSPPALP